MNNLATTLVAILLTSGCAFDDTVEPVGDAAEFDTGETGSAPIKDVPSTVPEDCRPGTGQCKCAAYDVNADGIIPPGGECEPGLLCIDGACETCPLGTIGCACDGSTCADGLECIEGLCGPCPSGQIGCACDLADECDVGLTCSDGLCVN